MKATIDVEQVQFAICEKTWARHAKPSVRAKWTADKKEQMDTELAKKLERLHPSRFTTGTMNVSPGRNLLPALLALRLAPHASRLMSRA